MAVLVTSHYIDAFVVLVAATVIAATTSHCPMQLKNAVEIYQSLNDPLELLCTPHHCSGQYLIEHLNHNTSQYDRVIQQRTYRIDVNIGALSDAGYYRCSKICNDGRSSPCRYFRVIVLPTSLEWNISIGAVVDGQCNITVSCSATGYPAPNVYAVVQPYKNCSYNYTNRYIKVDNYRGKVLIRITQAAISCLRVQCDLDNGIRGMQILNVTRKEPTNSTDETYSTIDKPTNPTDENGTTIPTKNGNSAINETPSSTMLLVPTLIMLYRNSLY